MKLSEGDRPEQPAIYYHVKKRRVLESLFLHKIINSIKYLKLLN